MTVIIVMLKKKEENKTVAVHIYAILCLSQTLTHLYNELPQVDSSDVGQG